MRIYLFFAVSAFALAQGSSYRWVKQIGGSGSDVAIGMAMDGAGNTYIAGNTLSRDFPVSNALQTHPGGAPLYKVDAATTAVTPLRNAGIDSVAAVAID